MDRCLLAELDEALHILQEVLVRVATARGAPPTAQHGIDVGIGAAQKEKTFASKGAR